MNIKTRCQASRCLSESTESQTFSGRHRQGVCAAWSQRPAARHRRPAACGQGRPARALTFPALARTQPSTPFALPRPSSSPVAAAVPAPRAAGAIADDSSSSLLLRHHNSSTATPATHHVHQCSLTVLGKRQHRAQARRSSTATSITVVPPNQTTPGHARVLARFTVAL